MKLCHMQVTCSPISQDDSSESFKIAPANSIIVPTVVAVISHYKWSKLGLVVENRKPYTQVYIDPFSWSYLFCTLHVHYLCMQ